MIRLDRLLFALACACIGSSVMAMDNIDIDGSIVSGPPSLFIQNFVIPSTTWRVRDITIDYPDPDAIYNYGRGVRRQNEQRFEAIMQDVASFQQPNVFAGPNGLETGQESVYFRPNGTTSVEVEVPTNYYAVRARLIYNGNVLADTNDMSYQKVSVTLTKTGTQSGGNYDQSDGTNVFTLETCFDSLCIDKNTNTLKIILDTWGSPGLAVHPEPNALTNDDFGIGCAGGRGTVVGNNGDTMCVKLVPYPSINVYDEFQNATMEETAIVARYSSNGIQPIGFYSYDIYGQMNEAEKQLCDSEEFECGVVGTAAKTGLNFGKMCGYNQSQVGTSNAIQHAVWAAVIARRLAITPPYTVDEAVVAARKWVYIHEADQCVIDSGTTEDEIMDCANNDYGLDVFKNNPSLNEAALIELIYGQIAIQGAGTVIYQGEACNVIYDPWYL